MGVKENVRNQPRFDAWSKSYDQGRIHKWFRFRQDLALQEMKLTNGCSVLDIGCGTGWAVRNISEKFPFVRVLGLDLSQGMVLEARLKLEKEKENRFLNADAEALPFVSNSLDYIFCTSSFHHYSSAHLALLEFKRVLKPYGKMILIESCRKASVGVWLWDRWLRLSEKGKERSIPVTLFP